MRLRAEKALVARASRPCDSCNRHTGETPVPLPSENQTPESKAKHIVESHYRDKLCAAATRGKHAPNRCADHQFQLRVPGSTVARDTDILMLRFGKKTDTASRMRMIGQLENEASARLFSDFLYAQGIENQTEPERSRAWALWIHAEEQLDAAKALLNEYRENPRDPKYQQASRVAEEKRKEEQKANAAAEKRFHDRSKLFSLGGLGVGY